MKIELTITLTNTLWYTLIWYNNNNNNTFFYSVLQMSLTLTSCKACSEIVQQTCMHTATFFLRHSAFITSSFTKKLQPTVAYTQDNKTSVLQGFYRRTHQLNQWLSEESVQKTKSCSHQLKRGIELWIHEERKFTSFCRVILSSTVQYID